MKSLKQNIAIFAYTIRRQDKSSRLRYGLALFAWVLINFAVPYAQAQTVSEKLVAAKPFVSTVIEGMALTSDKKGTPLAVTMPRGINAPLSIVDLKSARLISNSGQQTDGRESAGSAYVVLPNRHVIIGTSAGRIYDVDPDKQVSADQTSSASTPKVSFTSAVKDDQSTVYLLARDGSTGRLYQFGVSKTLRDMGSLPTADGGLAISGGSLFVGASNSSTILAVSLKDNSQTPINIPSVPAGTTELRVAGASGGYLYIQTVGSTTVTLVYDTTNQTVIDQQSVTGAMSAALSRQEVSNNVTTAPQEAKTVSEQPVISMPAPNTTSSSPTDLPSSSSSPVPVTSQPNVTVPTTNIPTTHQATSTNTQPPTAVPSTPSQQSTEDTGQTIPSATATVEPPKTSPQEKPTVLPVYFGALSRYDPITKSLDSVAKGSGLEAVRGNCWIDQTHCVVYGPSGKLGIVSTTSRSIKLLSPSPLMGGYHAVDNIAITGSDTVYASSTAVGTAVYQTDREKAIFSKMVAPAALVTTSLITKGSVVFTGTSNGQIATYQSTRDKSDAAFKPIATVGAGSVTALGAVSGGQLAFGLSQFGSKPSGAIGVYDTIKGVSSLAPQTVLADQTVASLAASYPLIYVGGSSSIAGTAGAQLIAYDMSTHSIVGRSIPVPGARSITSLLIGSNGHLYGVAGATVFEVNPRTLATVQSQSFYASEAPSNLVAWKDQLIASVGGKVYKVRPSDLNGTTVANGTAVAINSLGDLYYSRDGAIYKQSAQPQVAPVAASSTQTSAGFHFSMVNLRLGISTLALLLIVVAVPIMRIHFHRSTYSLRR